MKKPYSVLVNIVGFLTGSLINIILVAVVVVLIISYTNQAFENGKEITNEKPLTSASHPISVTIPDDADTLEIGGILEENGLITNKYYFYIQAFLNRLTNGFVPGTYTLNTNMTSVELAKALSPEQTEEPSSDEIRVTIPEGYNNRQIGELLESKGFFTAEEFLEACKNTDYSYDFLSDIKSKENYLEGYLFPDTYFLSPEPDPDELIKKMLNRFDDVYDYNMRLLTDEKGLTIDQVVTIASIIEKEINRPEERGLASSVIYNRLNENIPLQMCSTVMYMLDKRKDRLLESDLQIESPYNTYINNGLPAGPISNPGKASIEAALNPADSDFLYFVLKDEETGEHFFTNNYNDFLAAKEKYNQKF